MNAEIVTSGTELLLGEIVDTNSTYIARALRDAGINLYYKTSVGDNVERMALVLRQGLERSDLIITTGGLGPTVDDVTREAVALATGRALVLYPECLAAIEAIFARWGRPLGENNRRQAYLPAGAIPIMNPVGTAPGFIVETEKGTIIALPGVPREMQHLMQTAVIPYLKQRLGAEQAIIKAKNLRTVGLGESWIDERIDAQMRMTNPTVGLAAHYGIVDIRITARAATAAEADAMIADVEAQIRRAIGDEGIFGVDDDTLEGVTGRLLGRAGVKLALVESATGGEVARLLRSTPEGAAALTAAHVVDSPEALAERLAMSPAKLEAFGWISEMVAAEAAALLSDTYEGGWGLAVLGDLDARADVYGEQTGQTFVALATPAATVVRRYPYGGTGFLARQWVTLRALDLVRRQALVQLNQERRS
ncbi:MAG: CinA family nicotinamide mononucleotide deamidase-related protein [Anaerolineae bacterium]|nr:CinA family nicotinamide mononucleotide deamidase-related protein [Anaerolineae bacterium]